MGKTTIDAKRGKATFWVLPTVPKVVGLDTPHKRGEHFLWQSRACDPVYEPMAQYMAVYGCERAIDVWKDGEDVLVVAGRTQTKAARRANVIREERGLEPIMIELHFKNGTKAELRQWMIAENAIRRNPNAVEMAYDLAQTIKYGSTEEEAARAFGRSVSQLKSMLKLLELDEEVQAAVRDNKLPWTAAVALSGLSREKQVVELGKLLSGSVRPTAEVVRAHAKASREGRERVVVAPSKGTLRRLVNHEDAEVIFGEQGIKALKYALGECDERQFRGLAETIRALRE